MRSSEVASDCLAAFGLAMMSAWRSTHSLSATRAKGLGIGLQSSSPSVNGSYFWRVHAVNQAGEQGAFSAARSFTVTGVGAGAPATPVLAPTQGYNTFHPRESITFNWSPVANAPTYRLEVSTDPNFVLGTPATFWFDNLRTPTDTFAIADPGNYFARVFATDSDFAGGIRSLPSNTIQFSVSFSNPIGPAPVPVSPVAGETLTLPVTLKWAHVPNPQVNGYELQVATSSSFAINTIEVRGVEPGGNQCRGGQHGVGALCGEYGHHAERGERPPRDLVGCVFERWRQSPHLCFHDLRQCGGNGQRAVS